MRSVCVGRSPTGWQLRQRGCCRTLPASRNSAIDRAWSGCCAIAVAARARAPTGMRRRTIISVPPFARRGMDRLADAHIGGAAAEVAAHGEVDVTVGRPLVRLQQRDRAHDLARLAVAALRHVARDPGALHGHRFTAGDALDGGDLAVAQLGHGQRAGAHRHVAHQHGAGAAERRAAAELGAVEAPAPRAATQSSGVSPSTSTGRVAPLMRRMNFTSVS